MPRLDLTHLDLPGPHLSLLRELLARHVPTAEVWAYGSRVNGTAHEGSDLDLVLRDPNNLGADSEDWLGLIDAIQDSRLPILVEIHLWPRLPAAFRREIERQYVVLQEARAPLPHGATP